MLALLLNLDDDDEEDTIDLRLDPKVDWL